MERLEIQPIWCPVKLPLSVMELPKLPLYIDFIILSEPFNLKKPELVNKALLSGYINDRSLIWKSKSWFLKPPFYENVRSVTSHVRTHFYCTSLLNLLGWSEILYSFRFGYNFWLGQSKWKICITSRRSSYSQS